MTVAPKSLISVIYSPVPSTKRSVVCPVIAERPDDEALALPVRDDGLPAPGEVVSSAQRTNPPKFTSAKAG